MSKLTLGQRMRLLREDHGYTQEYISHLLNVERQTYTNYENGHRHPPLESLIHLSDIYHISLDYLIRGTKLRFEHKSINTKEHELLSLYKHLSSSDKKEIQDYIRFKLLNPKI